LGDLRQYGLRAPRSHDYERAINDTAMKPILIATALCQLKGRTFSRPCDQ
jgi:hypothetical protein